LDLSRDQSSPVTATRAVDAFGQRLAGGPISWGACEIPGWGAMPDADRVLGEMAWLGLRGTELGAPGFLPSEPAAIRAVLDRHGLELVGAFVPLVLHEPSPDDAARQAVEWARLLESAGSRMMVLALVQDMRWSEPRALDAEGWRRLGENVAAIKALVAEHGVTLALHPHVGTLIETADQVERALEALDVGWCLDTGHLFIGGVDPGDFARDHGDRVVHVHLKDVDATLAARVRDGSESLLSATKQGLFVALGKGDAPIGRVLEALAEYRYEGWLVLEQDTAITGDEPTVQGGPMRDARESIAFLHDSALTTQTQEVHR
jgi:inosose dehydratase